MGQNPKIQELTAQIQALAVPDRLALLRDVLTPELELRLLTEELSQRTSADPDAIGEDIDEAVQVVRAQRLRAVTA